MKTPTVISINPGAKTLGAISEENRSYNRAMPHIVKSLAVTPQLKETLNLLTGINTPAVSGTSRRILFLRLLTAAIMAYASVMLFRSGQMMPVALPLSILGGSILLGFATRIISLSAVGYCVYMALNGLLDLPHCGLIAFAALIFVILGPGIYSIDQMMRRSIFRHSRRRRSQRVRRSILMRPASIRMDYKAYANLQ